MGGDTGVVRKQAGTPGSWQQPVRKHEAGKVQNLPDVVISSQPGCGMPDNSYGVLPGKSFGPADTKMIALITRQAMDHREPSPRTASMIIGSPGSGS